MASPFPIPLNALRAIAVVARGGSLSTAAKELGVTPGAVSQHIRRAEARLGVMLFERTPTGLVPTAELWRIRPMLDAGFRMLADAIAALAVERAGILTVTTGSAFAARWLVPRLSRFTGAHPEIELRFVATAEVLDLALGDIDCAIRMGRGGWTGALAEKLMPQTVFPVCGPALASRLKRPADLATVPVIRDEGSLISWAEWFAAAGVASPPRLSGPSYTDPIPAIEAAVAGQGVFMAWQLIAADALADGRLVRPFPIAAPTEIAYWFVTTESRARQRKVQLFRAWLEAELTSKRARPVSGVWG
ncbi:LysR substrate-binding domain-containing protein [Inquilinus sp. NPDC058860]|uniref:LysR substrate-binding domain-containing protein n=1 Tax=Inquilinus sp. NPDC058860 TaxID=3346652 RepID=UPI0036CF8B9B